MLVAVFSSLLVLTPIALSTLLNSNKAEATWWNGSWGYRQTVNITNSGSTQTDFQVAITLDTATLITAGKMQSDCDDIRITGINGEILPYWIEEGSAPCNNASTKIWTKAPSIPTSGAVIYVYYGNPSAPSTQNGSKVFDFFDDFNKTTLDASKWTSLVRGVGGTVSMSAGAVVLSPTANTISSVNLRSSGTFTNNFIIQARRKLATNTIYMDFTVGYGPLADLDPGENSSWWHTTLQEGYDWMLQGSASDGIYYVYGAGQNRNGINSGLLGVDMSSYSVHQYSYGPAGEISWSINGTLKRSGTDSNILSNAKNILISQGEYSSGAGDVQSVDWIFVQKYASTQPTVGSPTNEEKTPGPVAYWKFDEGTGSNTYDSTSNKNTGSITGATWQSEDQCISGKCLYFNGSNALVSSVANFDSVLGNNFTAEAWIKINQVNKGSDNTIFGYGSAITGKGLHLVERSGKLYFGFYGDDISGSLSLSSNTWYHVAFVYDGGKKIYINGQLDKQSSSSPFTGTGSNFRIGKQPYGSGYFSGNIDESKIYPYARSADQVKLDYSSRGSIKGISTQIGSDNQLYFALSNGLVGYWKQDEATWSGTLSEVIDSSGNSNHGQAQGATGAKAYPTSAKFGNGGYFDGIDDYVQVPDSTTLKFGTADFTISGWVKHAVSLGGIHRGIYTKGSSGTGTGEFSFYIASDTNKLRLIVDGGSSFVDGTKTLNDNTWHHVIVERNGNTVNLYVDGQLDKTQSNFFTGLNFNSASAVKIGLRDGSRFFDGKIDEVRVYNRALSSGEVSALYNWAPGPIGYWSFEEGSGGTASDKSGYGNNGTWNGSGNHWTSGKYGKAGKFNGTNDYVGFAVPSITDYPVTISAWARPRTLDQGGIIVSLVSGSIQAAFGPYNTGNKILVDKNPSGGHLGLNGVSTYLTANKWQHWTVVHENATTVRFYLDGKEQTLVNVSDQYDASQNNIGARANGTQRLFNGDIDEVRIYNYARTTRQIVEDMNAGHPAPGSPVGSALGLWHFDEGYGNTVHNSGNAGSSLNGAITNATWTTNGKFGKALVFNGSNSLVDFGVNTINSRLNGASAVTLETWMKPTSYPGGSSRERMISIHIANSYTGAILSTYGTNQVEVAGRSGTADSLQTATYTLPNPTSWHHIVGVLDYPNDQIRIYVDGVLVKTQAVTFTNTTYTASTCTTHYDTLGAYKVPSTDDYYDGVLDLTKVYNIGLTDEQVKIAYNQGQSLVLGSFSDTSGITGGSVASSSASALYCVPGDTTTCTPPVAEWNFEEKQGSTANDSSGNNNNGTLTNASWSQGHAGSGVYLNGTSAYVDNSSLDNSNFPQTTGTVSLWVKGNFTSQQFKAIFDDYASRNHIFIRTNDGSFNNLQIELQDSGGAYIAGNNFHIDDNVWNHLVVTYNTSTDLAEIYINGQEKYSATMSNSSWVPDGQDTKLSSWTWFQGYVDQVKIFNYVRTPAQVAWDYNQGKPVGHWKLNECQGSTAYDSSGNKNHGTITIGGSGAQTTVGTCSTPTDGTGAWYNGKTGKYNSSLNLDGDTDYVDVPSLTWAPTSFSVSFWLYPTTLSNYNQDILATNGWGAFTFHTTTTGEVYVGTDLTNRMTPTNLPAGTLVTGQWQHFVFSFDNGTGKFYKNGKLLVTKGSMVNPTAWGGFEIGNSTSSSIDGKVDDVRVYSYALTPYQVKQVVNQGAGVRWGPVTGTP
ncbi:MAG: DUF2341 domain-containing protein [Candidatus Levyibacteriota bacterium]